MEVPQTDKEFEQLVRQLMEKEGLTFIHAIYQLVDQLSAQALQEQGIQLACHKGCCFCCHQLITCTPMEWRAIRVYFPTLSFRPKYWLRRRLPGLQREWLEYHQQKGKPAVQNPIEVHDHWLGKPCPFLNHWGECDIYPVRPIVCRGMSSTIKCSQWQGQPGVRYMVFGWERWANNLILDNTFPKAVTPLLHWLCCLDLSLLT